MIPLVADFRKLRSVPALSGATLDGVLLANALHFVAEPTELLTEVARLLRSGGKLVIVEYDHRPASRWVPYPVSEQRLHEILPAAGFHDPAVVASRASRYGGRLYAAVAPRRDPGQR